MPSYVPVDLDRVSLDECYSLTNRVAGAPIFAVGDSIARCRALLSGLLCCGADNDDGFLINHKDVMNNLFTVDDMLKQAQEILDKALSTENLVRGEVKS